MNNKTPKQQRTIDLAEVGAIADTTMPESKFAAALFQNPDGTKLILSKAPWARTAAGIKEFLQNYIDRLEVEPVAKIKEGRY